MNSLQSMCTIALCMIVIWNLAFTLKEAFPRLPLPRLSGGLFLFLQFLAIVLMIVLTLSEQKMHGRFGR